MAYKHYLIVVFLCMWEAHFCYGIFNGTKEPANFDEMKANITGLTNTIVEWIFPMALKIIEESNTSIPCRLSLLQFLKDIKNLREWALKMLDASGKPAAGILQGTFFFYGDYDECLDIVATNERKKHLFVGKYCMVQLYIPEFVMEKIVTEEVESQSILSISSYLQENNFLAGIKQQDKTVLAPRLGLCVPSVCTATEINLLFHSIAGAYGVSTNVNCETKMTKEPTTLQLTILCVFALFIFLAIVGTGFHLLKQHIKKEIIRDEFAKLLMCFSVYGNTVNLFRSDQNNRTLPAIRGCRVLTMFWVVLGHTYFGPEAPLNLLKYRGLLKFFQSTTLEMITNATVALDTFFVLSGLLFVYTIHDKLLTQHWIHAFILFLGRMKRILLLEMLVIALFMILPLFGNGPIWNETFKEAYDVCTNYWWTNLLFIQNFWSIKQICLRHTWFLGVLGQLHLFIFGLVLLLYRRPKIAISINVLLILMGCFITGLLTSLYHLPSSLSKLIHTQSGWLNYTTIIYHRPYTYISSYCVGILLGYAIVTKRHLKIKPWLQLLYWLMAITGVLTALYGGNLLNIYNNRDLHVVYAAFHRTLWSFSLSWMLFACIVGYGGLVERILSWKGFVSLEKISLHMYLLHPLVTYYHAAKTRTLINFNQTEQVYLYLATIVITICLSYLFQVLIVQPFLHLPSFAYQLFSKNPLSGILYPNILPPSRNKETSPQGIIINSYVPKLEEITSSKL